MSWKFNYSAFREEQTSFIRDSSFQLVRDQHGRLDRPRSGDDVEESGETEDGLAFLEDRRLGLELLLDGGEVAVVAVPHPLG